MGKLKVFEAFAGVGSQRMALNRLDIDFEIVGICEIDKFALKSYEAIHGECPNFGDISKVDVNDLPNMDLFTYSYPCQDLSTAGKQKGLSEGTRSGLLYECEKIIENKKPKYLLLENVKNLVGKKFKKDFDKWLEYLEGLGYTNYWKILNAKNFNVPQNRERVFVVSILNDKQGFEFPKAVNLDKAIKDILESNVDEKYYINKSWHFTQPWESNHNNGEIAKIDKGNYLGTRTIQDVNKICRCIDTMGGGQRESKILCDPVIVASRGRDLNNLSDRSTGNKNLTQVLEINKKGTSNTLTTVQKDNYVLIPQTTNYRVRKLTPLECWRLMDFSDEDFYKAKNAGISNSQLYKQAGNSIVVKVLEEIFKNLLLQNTKNNLSIEEVKREEDNNMQLKYNI